MRLGVKFSTLKVWQIHWPQFTVNWEYFASENKRIVSGFFFSFSISVPYFYLAFFIYGIILVSLSNLSFCEVCIRGVLLFTISVTSKKYPSKIIFLWKGNFFFSHFLCFQGKDMQRRDYKYIFVNYFFQKRKSDSVIGKVNRVKSNMIQHLCSVSFCTWQ